LVLTVEAVLAQVVRMQLLCELPIFCVPCAD